MTNIDMNTTIIAKSDQLNADDLMGRPITVTISKVTLKKGADQPIIINYEGDAGKPYKPSKGMRRALVLIWGDDGSVYVGRRLTLYREESVKWAGEPVGGIQISHASDIQQPVDMSLTVSRGVKKPYRVLPIKTDTTRSRSTEQPENTAKAETPQQKLARRISTAIETSTDEGDLADLWTKSYAADLAALKKDAPKFYDIVKTKYEARVKSFADATVDA